MTAYHEPARDVPVIEEADVVVCGGGPAGVAAAIAAARSGARTCLLEMHGCLGGIWTAGLLSWLIEPRDKPGIMDEITAALYARGSYAPRGRSDHAYAYAPEVMKLVLEEMAEAAGVKTQLFTHVCAAARGANNRLDCVLTESKSGRQAWRAKAFVDATGDGDLAAQAGCKFDLGRDGTGECQPMSLECLFTGVQAKDIEPFIGGRASEPKKRLLAEMQRAGVTPSYAAPTILRIRDDLFCLAANHEYNVSAVDAGQITAATIRARAELHRLVDALRGLGAPWATMQIVVTGEQIGVREGRRIRGLYQVTIEDLMAGARHEDAICRLYFGIDVHSPNPGKSKGFSSENRGRTKPYDIPLRALIAKDVDGLLMAGRNISGDFLAHSSYRITGGAVGMGQAAGVAAAVAAASNRTPREVPWADFKPALDRVIAGAVETAKKNKP